MKVIFLDIDGVLNSHELAMKNNEAGLSGYGGWFDENDVLTHENVLWGQELVGNLKHIVEATDSKIVISSTWRVHFTTPKFLEMFKVYGWENAPVIDGTERFGSRGEEVAKYIKENNVKSYVILDDCDDFLPSQKEFFVHTDSIVGLTKEDAEKAIEILNRK